MLSADTIAWSSIALATIHASFTDITMIHGKYTLRPKEKLKIVLHQFVIMSVLFGALFQETTNVQTHMLILLGAATCWYWFDGCFMAKWQRDTIAYTPADFTIIHKPKHTRTVEFLGTVVPLFLFDCVKLLA